MPIPDSLTPQEMSTLMTIPPIQALLEAVEEVLEDFRCAESEHDYVPIEEALLRDLWLAFQPFDLARTPGSLLEE